MASKPSTTTPSFRWWGNVIDTKKKDPITALMGRTVDNESSEEEDLDNMVGIFGTKSKRRRRANTGAVNTSLSAAWSSDLHHFDTSQPDLDYTFRTTTEQEIHASERHKRQHLHGRYDAYMLSRISEIEALLADDPNYEEKLGEALKALHKEARDKNTSPLSLPSIVIFTVNDNQTLSDGPTPPEHNTTMFFPLSSFFLFILCLLFLLVPSHHHISLSIYIYLSL